MHLCMWGSFGGVRIDARYSIRFVLAAPVTGAWAALLSSSSSITPHVALTHSHTHTHTHNRHCSRYVNGDAEMHFFSTMGGEPEQTNPPSTTTTAQQIKMRLRLTGIKDIYMASVSAAGRCL